MCSTRNPIKITADESKDNTDEFSDMTKTTSDSDGHQTRRKTDIQKIVSAYNQNIDDVRVLVNAYRKCIGKGNKFTTQNVPNNITINDYRNVDNSKYKLFDYNTKDESYSISKDIMNKLDA
jgi:lipid II:glycine glycyltransferase (peptidoglycan interpeptide bridge formation enzyme)